MWEKTLIESRGGETRKWWMFPFALFLHALVIGIIVGASYWIVEAIQAPPIPVTLFSAPPPPPPPPPAMAKKKAEPEAPKPEPKAEQPKEVVQPTEIPQEIPTPEFTPSEQETEVEGAVDTGASSGMEGGVEGGVVGGVPGGVVGGVPGGVIGGVPGGIGDEVPMRITAEIQQPVLIKKVESPYPEPARRARIEGVVILEAIITKTGTVEQVKVLKPLHTLLDQAAINAVKQWKYKPAMMAGRPVKVYFTVTVTFRLTQEATNK